MKRKHIYIVLFIVLCGLAGLLYLNRYLDKNNNVLLLISGRVEADEIVLSSRIPGRLKEVYISDGQYIDKGAPVAKIDDQELKAMYEEIEKTVMALKKSIDTQEETLGYLRESIQKKIEGAEKSLNLAMVRMKQAKANLQRQKKRLERFRSLYEKGVVPEDRFEDIRLAYITAKGDFDASVEAVEQAKVALEGARIERTRIRIKEKEIASLRQKLASLKKRLSGAKIRLSYTLITAPTDGVILKRVSEPGEVLGAGGVIGIMIRPESIHVKTFIPEPLLGRVKVGTGVRVFTDAFPDRPVMGEICYISDRAEFTPKEVQSKQERIKQVFEAKICFPENRKEALGVLKKGMPVDVEIPTKS
ncbi:MAG: HlyD family efflux transporter periplasmic adaptor subunit [Nitrospirae bacterium]|nr:HlyD family efflux transporter periplasmic adaptor subunit [Nitrospirota bacterium]